MTALLRLTAAFIVVTIAVPAWAQISTSARPPQTDQTVNVARGIRLTVDNYAGEVIVRAWARDAVRVQARHALSRARVSVRRVQNAVAVSASGSPGSTPVDYEINVPAWMPVKIDGHYAYIAVEGTESEVAAETVRGTVSIKGGAEFVSAKSIEGEVIVEGARGRMTLRSVSQGITVTAASGEITAETVNGPIRLSAIESDNVEAGSLNGSITYEGSASPRGRYRFSTHNGSIVIAVPETAGATFSVRTYNGSLNAGLPLQTVGEIGRGRRATYTLGNGGAEFELESFGGTINVRKRGTAPARAAETKKEL